MKIILTIEGKKYVSFDEIEDIIVHLIQKEYYVITFIVERENGETEIKKYL